MHMPRLVWLRVTELGEINIKDTEQKATYHEHTHTLWWCGYQLSIGTIEGLIPASLKH